MKRKGCPKPIVEFGLQAIVDEIAWNRSSREIRLMHPRGPNTLIFDYDGVVADTEPLHWKTWARILEPRGIQFNWDQYCRFGRGIHDAQMIDRLSVLFNEPSLPTVLEELITRHNELMRELCASALPIGSGTVELLHSLRNYRLGLVTGSPRSEVEPVLRAAGVFECFNAMVFRDDVEHHKPSPDPYLLLGSLLGVKTGLAFEDSEAGIASAQSAGFLAISVDAPEHLPEIVMRAIREQEE
jgi:HAD superfamily hydrolase (TIGR01509 family)